MPESGKGQPRDLFRGPGSAALWWGAPLLVGVVVNIVHLSSAATAFVWAGVFAWMGAGCLINASRCGRVHCYISGPVFVLGAVACGLIGAGVFGGSHAVSNAVSATLLAALLSFLPEWIWRRYA